LRHGHGKTNSFAGIPFYGISKKHSAYQELYRSRGGFDYEAMGHFHTDTVLKDGKVFMNGSGIGANEYSIGELALFSHPTQKLLGVTEKYGVTVTYPIRLTEDENHPYIYNPDRLFETREMVSDFISGLP